MTNFGKLESDYLAIAFQAAQSTLEGTDPERITDVYVSSFAPCELCGINDPCREIAHIIEKAYPTFQARFHGPFKTGGEALHASLKRGYKEEGLYNKGFQAGGEILLLACEKMTHVSAGNASLLLSNRVNPHDREYGATLPTLGALVSRSYMLQYKVPYTAFHRVSAKNHHNGRFNPKAQFQNEIDEAEVAKSPVVSDPLRRLHCAPISDGAVGLLLSRDEGDVFFRGWARGLDTPLFQERDNIARFRATLHASRIAHARSGTRPEDVNVVEIHDAFSPFELINLEEMGFFRTGEAWRALEGGELNINGRIAVNPSGGLKARGHPIGVCGLSSVVEVYEQLTQIAGKRQHKPARLAMIQSAGGVSRESYVFIMDTV